MRINSFDVVNHKWESINPDGTRFSILEGDRSIGNFSYLLFLPAGVWDNPHWHTGDSRIFVMRGELKLCFSKRFDKSKARSFRQGSLVVVPRDTAHFDGADVDTTILGFGTGPWSTAYIRGN